MNEASPTRPILRYFGGKWNLGKWIIKEFPPHRCYVEPFGGAGSVLLQKKPVFQEVYNDMDSHMVDMFRVLRDPDAGPELIRQLQFTPFSRLEYEEAYSFETEPDPIEKARKIITLSFLAYSTDGVTTCNKTGFRSGKVKNRYQPACHDWTKHADTLWAVLKRLKRVIIENISAIKCLHRYDAPETLFYLDPPYPHSTRYEKRGYRHEMTLEDHEILLDECISMQSMIAISTYKNDFYAEKLSQAGWKVKQRQTRAQAGNGKANKIATEQLWLNPKLIDKKPQLTLFN